MSEWLKEHAWKACVGETLPWVRIPPSPPDNPALRLFRAAPYAASEFASVWLDDVLRSTYTVRERVITNTQGQVLNWRNEEPIPGFYACGGSTVTGFIWGMGYQGGSDLAVVVAFALLCAEHAAGGKV